MCVVLSLSLVIKGLSKTPKAHLVFGHLTDFCKRVNAGLGHFSEQTFERAHSSWREHSRYRLHGVVAHPDYGAVLLKVCKDFNVLHLG